jgi:hypothetical protein
MAAPKPNTPYIEKSPTAPGNPHQPPPRIIENPPARTLAQAIANSKRVFDQAK